jgi:hypothetical protein
VNPTTINRLVAERVMGWKLEKHRGWESWWEHDSIAKRKKYIAHDWKPARDMNQAWEVVRKMRERNYAVRIEANRFEGDPLVSIWANDDNTENRPPCDFDAGDNRRPEEAATAICLAALRAVGVPEEEVNRE